MVAEVPASAQGSDNVAASPEGRDGKSRPSQWLVWARQSAARARQFEEEHRGALAAVQVEQCVHCLQMALDEDPEDFSSRCFLVGCHMALGNYPSAKEQALSALCKLTQEHALLQDPWLHLAIAHISSRLGQHEDAIAFAQRASVEYPWHPRPCAMLGRAMLRRGRTLAAKQMSQRALDRDDDHRCVEHLSLASRQVMAGLLEQRQTAGKGEASPEGADAECGIAMCQGSLDGEAIPCGEGAGAVRHEFSGVAVEECTESTPCAETTRPDDLGSQRPDGVGMHGTAPAGATASPGGLQVRPISPRRVPEDRHLGVHEILVDNHVVNHTSCSSSAVIGTLSAGTLVRVSGAVINQDDCVWGRVHQPLTGWIALVNLRTSLKWAKQVPSTRVTPSSPRVRCRTFGRPKEPGPEAKMHAAAVSDLEQIFSGLMPATISPLARHKEAAGSTESKLMGDRCNKCYTCCADK